MGQGALDVLGDGEWVPVPALGRRPARADGEADVPWPCDAENKYIVHFPETREIWSYGSGYGGNALLGKKCFALRIASTMARDDGWMAEHMLILRLTNPEGEKKYIAAAFPSACGKTNMAMLIPTLPGWKVETDRRRHRLDEVRRRRPALRHQPRGRLLRRRSRHRRRHQPQRDGDAVGQLHLHQHRPHRRRRRVVGGHDRRAAGAPHRLEGQRLDARERRRPAAHPNARFTAPAAQCPSHRPRVGGPGRRADLGHPVRRPPATNVPLVTEAFDWQHGVFLGSIMASEKTAAAAGTVGELRFDPFAMLPFCGYNMGDYFAHWLDDRQGHRRRPSCRRSSGSTGSASDQDGRFLWPGFGENSRVLKWVFERVDGDAERRRHRRSAACRPASTLDTTGLDIDRRRPRRAALGRRRRLERGDPADPRALRPVRRAPPRPAGDGGRRARSPPELTVVRYRAGRGS